MCTNLFHDIHRHFDRLISTAVHITSYNFNLIHPLVMKTREREIVESVCDILAGRAGQERAIWGEDREREPHVRV